jgi:hypothetical protein
MVNPNIIVLNGFLDDYRKQRAVAPSKSVYASIASAASSFKSALTTKATNIENIHQTWERFSDSFAKNAHLDDDKEAAKQWVDTIIDLGDTAFIFQQASAKRSRSSAALHAARAFIFLTLKESAEGNEAIQARITKLEAELVSIKKSKNEIPADSADIKKRTTIADDDYHTALRSLAFLGVIKNNDKDSMAALFPGYDFPAPRSRDSLPTFSQINGIKLNQNLPYILHEDYTKIYLNKIDDKDKPNDEVAFITLEEYVKERTQRFNYKYALSSALVSTLSPPKHLNGTDLSTTAKLAGTINLSKTSQVVEPEHKGSTQSHHPTPSNDAVVTDLSTDSAVSLSVTPPHTSMAPS